MSFLKAVAALLLLAASAASAETVFKTDIVFPHKSFGRPHGASMVEVKNGGILASWFSASAETKSDAEIYGSFWDGAGNWSKPFTIIPNTYTKSVGNTALFRDDDGLVWMFFAAVRFGGWSGAMVDYVTSRDDGKTWSDGKNLVAWPGNLPRNPPVKVGDHLMLVPLFVDFWYEADIVGSYTALIKYQDGKVLEKTYVTLDDSDSIQPALIPLKDGRILMLTRDKSDRFIRRSYSKDGGKSWSPASMTTLPNPGAGICAMHVKELDAVLVAYNHSRKGRNPLSLAISFDGGSTFKRIANLEYRPGEDSAAFDYPAMLRTGDGLIHVLWTHDDRATLKHAMFNVEWLSKTAGNPNLNVPVAETANGK